MSVSSAINSIFSIGMRRDELDIDLILCSVGAVLAKCGIIVGEWRWRRASAMNTGAGRLTTGKKTSFLLVNETRREAQRLMSLIFGVQVHKVGGGPWQYEKCVP